MKKLIILMLVAGAATWWFRDPTITAPGTDISYSYSVEYPDGSTSGATLPMLIALHGNGDTPDNFYQTALDTFSKPLRIILLKGPLAMGMGGSAWPTDKERLQPYSEALAEVVKLLEEKYPTQGRPMILGFSGGAWMAYYQAAVHPDQYSYIFPVSGGLAKDLLAGTQAPGRRGAQVYAFHGKQDTVIGIDQGRNAIDVLRSRAIKVNFNEFEGGHHGIFTNAKQEITALIENKMNRL